ncbi:MAG TPA: carbohydrate kinase family protein [Trueperaceae bacterium]|nr:carbohydrate kinase family protein [Trueperaceae bacterium]
MGDYAWDVLIRGNTELLAGGDIYGEVQLAPGGSAANTAVWARRCGLPTRFVGKIGNDRFGRLAQDELRDEDVRAVWLHTDTQNTGSVAVWIDHTGQRSMVSGKGADHYLLPSELPGQLLRRAGHLHLSAWSFFGDPPRSAARRAAQIAKQAGATLSFDPGSFQLIGETGLETFVSFTADLGLDLVFPNAEEGEALTGETEPELVCRRLCELYPGAAIALKLDSEGAYYFEDGVGTHLGPAAGRLVDATGAGDAFAGAFLAARLRGVGAVKAAALANMVSAWVIERVGARPVLDKGIEPVLQAFDSAVREAGWGEAGD